MKDTYELVVRDSRKAIQQWIYELRQIIKWLAEHSDDDTTTAQKAVRRWLVFLGVLIVDLARAIVELAPTYQARPIALLMRSIYEYLQKAKYFMKVPKDAKLQMKAYGGLVFSETIKMQYPNDAVRQLVVSRYLEWKKTAGSVNERSGRKALLDMHLETTDERVLTDKDGNKYTYQHHLAYGVPSLWAHGEAAVFEDVFPDYENDKSSLRYVENGNLTEALGFLNLTSTWIGHFCAETARHYKQGQLLVKYRELNRKNEIVRNRSAALQPWELKRG